jgi:hypothetical protein
VPSANSPNIERAVGGAVPIRSGVRRRIVLIIVNGSARCQRIGTNVALPAGPGRQHHRGVTHRRKKEQSMTLRILVASLVASLVALASTAAALAKDGDVRVTGRCTAASSVKLRLSPEDGRLEVELEVDQNRSGVRWSVHLTRNGATVARTTAVTTPRSGSFSLRRVIPSGGRVAGLATSPAGERCVVAASHGA